MAEIEPLKPLVPQKLKFTLLDDTEDDVDQTQEKRVPFTITNFNNDARYISNKNTDGERMSKTVCYSGDKENNDMPPIENVVTVFCEEVVESQVQCERPVTPHNSENTDSNQPLTPTANLKMLFSAVSPELRNRENKRQELFRAEQSDESLQEFPATAEIDIEISASQESESGKSGSRKEKSLGLLCQKFLHKYPEYPCLNKKIQICLDEVAKELNVERRRIYDIVNVLESVEIVSRIAKNKYAWHGKTNLVTTLSKLKVLGEAEGFFEQIQKLKDYELNRELEEQNENNSSSEKPSSQQIAESLGLGGTGVIRKDKSLGIMSQKFLMLFLVSKPRTVNLDQSAKILIGDPNVDRTENAKFKTKIRRLYDIANILTSLDLIRKVHVTEFRGRKPAFKYIGPDIDNAKAMDVSCSDGCHRPSSRHSMLDCVKNQNVTSIMNYRPICPAETPLRPADTPVCQKTKIVLVDPIIKEKKYRNDTEIVECEKSERKAFARHSSFEQICQVAETERNKLYASVSLPASPVKDIELKEDKPVGEFEPTRTQNISKHVILQHSDGKFRVIDGLTKIARPQIGHHYLPVQTVVKEKTNKAVPKSPHKNEEGKLIPETILIKSRSDTTANKTQTVIPLTKDQITAVLKSLKVPVPFNKDQVVISDTTGTQRTEMDISVDTGHINKKRPCPDSEQSTPVEKRIKTVFPTPPSDSEDVRYDNIPRVSPSGIVNFHSLPPIPRVLSPTQSETSAKSQVSSSVHRPLVQMPLVTIPSSETVFMNSPLVSSVGQSMPVIQRVSHGSSQPISFMVPITYSPPLTPVNSTSPTLLTFPVTQSSMPFSSVHLLQPPIIKPITVSAVSNPMTTCQSTSLLQTPTNQPISVSPSFFFGNTPSSFLPIMSESLHKSSRLAFPIVAKDTVLSTARRLNLPPL